ncbi:hypothetical protein CY34DRAFT_813657 [Suillus luteus UH-Slu-Lm8-n1]|uniref:Uncharacterized protein n=1 Tax=Suillus luteus UH-Slu-Lm8-n1 TaxID=930992 RepID=A0A0D0A5A7_9AGAM|nr:hypothetical protein CY34DRAFT_813657 [Suillus luteus UH-Slu-Lm8-n1]
MNISKTSRLYTLQERIYVKHQTSPSVQEARVLNQSELRWMQAWRNGLQWEPIVMFAMSDTRLESLLHVHS